MKYISYTHFRDPPPNRRRIPSSKNKEFKEQHFPEAAVMIATAIHFLNVIAKRRGNRKVHSCQICPDGMHESPHFHIKDLLEENGFSLIRKAEKSKTKYAGEYRNARRDEIKVYPRPGQGDVSIQWNNQTWVVECKGGIINSNHPGPLSKLRRGLYEAFGQISAFQSEGTKRGVVVPKTNETIKHAKKFATAAKTLGVTLLLVDENGQFKVIDGNGQLRTAKGL